MPARKTGRLIEASNPDAIHVATEGPAGPGRQKLVHEAFSFVHDFLYDEAARVFEFARAWFPTAWTYAVMRWFHRPAAGIMVSTDTLHGELTKRGFRSWFAGAAALTCDCFGRSRRISSRLRGQS